MCICNPIDAGEFTHQPSSGWQDIFCKMSTLWGCALEDLPSSFGRAIAWTNSLLLLRCWETSSWLLPLSWNYRTEHLVWGPESKGVRRCGGKKFLTWFLEVGYVVQWRSGDTHQHLTLKACDGQCASLSDQTWGIVQLCLELPSNLVSLLASENFRLLTKSEADVLTLNTSSNEISRYLLTTQMSTA